MYLAIKALWAARYLSAPDSHPNSPMVDASFHATAQCNLGGEGAVSWDWLLHESS